MDTHQILQAVKAEISRLQKVVNLLEETSPSPKVAAATAPKRRGLSAAARKKISLAQKARWAAFKAKR